MFRHSICHKRCFLWRNNILSLIIGITVMKISFVTNSTGISDKIKFCHIILSLMLGFPVVILVCMLVGLKSVVVSRTTGLYGLKFVKLSVSTGDFLI
jgi:ABC-type methionine transport system permease subunit